MKRRVQQLAILAFAVIVAACNGSPAAPSGSNGVTINGAFVDSGDSGGTQSAGPQVAFPGGTTVSISGTTISAVVESDGRFVLKNAPAGTIVLRFVGPTVDATVTVTDLQTGQVVTLTFSTAGSSVVLQSDRRSLGSAEQLEGKVESLPPTTAAGTFVVSGRTVTTDSNTRFLLRGGPVSFSALELGFRVHVSGQASGTSLLASVVDIQNTNGSALNINGVVSGFSGTSAAFEFTVDGKLIKGDAVTEFYGNSVFAMLANGVTVEVKGLQRTGFVYASRIHVETEDAEFTGTIVAPITGTSPNLQFLVDSSVDHTVQTTSSTVVKRGGDTQTPAQLQPGMTVSVSGSLLPGGNVVAKHIGIEADAVGGLFQMTGHIGGLSGACPTVSFSVGGYSIVTVAGTTFVPNCTSLSNGNTVTVKGVVQSGGSVQATEVKKN